MPLAIHMTALVALGWLSILATASRGYGQALSHFTVAQAVAAGYPRQLAERQTIITCMGSLIFTVCGGGTCAPPGYFCCGAMGACPAGSTCMNDRCCPPGVDPKQCQPIPSEMINGDTLDSLINSLATMSEFQSMINTQRPTTRPTGTGTGTVAPLPTGTTLTSIGGHVTAPVPQGPSLSISAVSTRSRKFRSIDLKTEVEVTDSWETSVSCNPLNAGLRTNKTGATLKMELSTDVAGFTVSESVTDGGKLGIKVGGVDVAGDIVPAPAPPAGAPAAGTSTGCAVSYKWKRSMSVGAVKQTVSLTWELPLVVLDKRQGGNSGAWGQINEIIAFSSEADIDNVVVAQAFDASKIEEAVVVPSSGKGAEVTSGPTPSPTQSTSALSVPAPKSGASKVHLAISPWLLLPLLVV